MLKRFSRAFPMALLGAVWCFCLSLPWPWQLGWWHPSRTAFMEMRIRAAQGTNPPLTLHRRWVPLDRISPQLRRAVLVGEDARFYEHHGVDWRALAEEVHYHGDGHFSLFNPADWRALWDALGYYRQQRTRIRGRSTITQQLAKNLYFSSSRSILRKVEELIVARRLECFLSKDRILELYLNYAEWGPGIFGAEAAARSYFGVSAAQLTTVQAAALAATLPHPLTSNPRLRPGRMTWRQNLILARMGAGGPVQTVPLDSIGLDTLTIDLSGVTTEPLLPADALPRDSLRRETLPPDSVAGETVRHDPLRRDTIPPDTLRRDHLDTEVTAETLVPHG